MKSPKNIFLLISHPIQYYTPLYNELSKNEKINLEVFYCSTEGVENFFDKEFSSNISWGIDLLAGHNFQFLKNYSPLPSIFSGFFGLINFQIIKLLYKGEYDFVLVHGWNYFSHILTIIFSKIFNIKTFIRGDNPLGHELLKPKWKIILKKIFLQSVLFKIIDGFLYVGKENYDFYKFYNVPDEKLFFTPHAVDNSKFTKEFKLLNKYKNKLRNEYGIPSDKVVVLFVGKLINKKSPYDLITAFQKVVNKNKFLIIVGEGVLKSEIQKYIQTEGIKNIKLLGFIDQKEIPKIYKLSDLIVLPSGIGETWGLVINEAMNFKLPVIVSDLVGCGPDLVKNGKNGFIYKYGDTESLSENLDKLISNKELRNKFGEKSLKIINKYNYEKTITTIDFIIQNYLKKS